MSHELKIDRAKAVIAEHNKGLPDGVEAVDAEAFLHELRKLGGTTDDGLKACSWEDLEQAGLPRLLAKQVARIFREGNDEDRSKPITEKVALGMTPRELIEHYDPRDPENAVGKRLLDLSKGKRFVVFNDDGAVRVGESVKLLEEVRSDHPERDHFTIDGRPRKTYRVGERLPETADENPLYAGEMLRPDGTCTRTDRDWSTVPHDVRVLVFLAAAKSGEIRVNSLDDAHRVIDLASTPDAADQIRKRYPVSSVLFDELEREGKLPTLKVRRGGTAGAGRVQNPFEANARHQRY